MESARVLRGFIGDITMHRTGSEVIEFVKAAPPDFRNPASCPALVLNADFRPLSYYPLSLWSWQDTLKAVVLDRVNIAVSYTHLTLPTKRIV